MSTEQTEQALPVREQGQNGAGRETASKSGKEAKSSKDSDDDDTPRDPAKYIEAHILPRLGADYIDYYVKTVLRNPSAHEVTIDEVRADPAKFRPMIAVESGDGHFPRVADYAVVSAVDAATIPVRAYHPDPAEHGPGPYPLHINFHGGGFVLGDLHTDAQLCLSMREAGVVVLDVNYRHCPESLWGACFEDAWSALTWARASADTLRIRADSVSVGGISAGGHITLVLHQRARDEGVPLRMVLPTVPPSAESLFYRFYVDSPYASFHEFVRTAALPWSRIRWFSRQCLSSVQRAGLLGDGGGGDGGDSSDSSDGLGSLDEPAARAALEARYPKHVMAPIRLANWKGLAEVYVRTAELDMLRDEGEDYAMRVAAHGTRASIKRYLGGVHSFMCLDFLPQKREYDVDSIVALRQAHGLPALPPDVVLAKVDRIIQDVRAKKALDKTKADTQQKDE